MRISDWSSDLCSSDLIDEGLAFSVKQFGGYLFELDWPSANPDVLDRVLGELLRADAALISDRGFAIPRLFVSDMDSTMIGQECIDELADFADIKHQIAAITERAMQGELDFESALRERVLGRASCRARVCRYV